MHFLASEACAAAVLLIALRRPSTRPLASDLEILMFSFTETSDLEPPATQNMTIISITSCTFLVCAPTCRPPIPNNKSTRASPRRHCRTRSEEHTSELQPRGLISYAVF